MRRLPHALFLTGLILGAVAAAGCHHHDRDASDRDARPPATRLTPDDLPPAVRVAFRRDYPDAAITAITPMSAETGSPLFKVSFIDNRTAGSATYYMNGQRIKLPSTIR
jgi:hypothetical protein